jgi:acylphosphatase
MIRGDVIQAHVYVAGRVQGVGYRANTERQARQLSLTGWVRNLPDGRVEAVFEGARPQVEAMLNWCHKGPISARVSEVQVMFNPAEGLESFQVRY